MDDQFRKRYEKNVDSIWIPREKTTRFGYSDGLWVERYLEDVFRKSTDLSSDSEDLEGYIRDWNTEYHLSRKRKDLLSGLNHKREARVLEIGCGCGAITRFLGERYGSVVAVEGSYNRAKLTRLRTKELSNVEVIASTYQSIGLEGTFDIVFCIGVLEYAPTYVNEPSPFLHALASMKKMLKPNGTLVIAIENKLGLKYFSNSTEDHAGTFFEGIEGYPRTSHLFETFGRREFASMLKKYWKNLDFYFPFPDYKIPSLLLAESALSHIDVAELVGSLTDRDYARINAPLFDNRLAWREFSRNGLVQDFANSFLVVAGNGNDLAPDFSGRFATMFNRDRRARFSTVSYIEQKGEKITVQKSTASTLSGQVGKVSLQPESTDWVEGPTIAYQLFRDAHSPALDLEEQMRPVKHWWSAILSLQIDTPAKAVLPGKAVDFVWHNAILKEDDSVYFFDRELVWHDNIRAEVIFIRAAMQWVQRYGKQDMPRLSASRGITTIRKMANAINLKLTSRDFREAIALETNFQSEVGRGTRSTLRMKILVALYCPKAKTVTMQMNRAKVFLRRVYALWNRITVRQ